MKKEWDAQKERNKKVMAQIKEDKGQFFIKLDPVQKTLAMNPAGPEDAKGRSVLVGHLVGHMLHYCIIPRLFLAPEDAVYSAKFIHLLHSEATPGYSSLQVSALCVWYRHGYQLQIQLTQMRKQGP